MGYNTYETIENTLRGEPYGQLTPEGQRIWDEYQSLLNAQKAPPMRNLRLPSGASMQIVDPGFGLKNRALSKTLGGMTNTGMGTRAGAQPGLFAQLAPLFIAAGIKDPKMIQKMLSMFGGGSGTESPGSGGLPSGGMGGDDWGNLGGGSDLSSGGFGGEDWGDLGGGGGYTDIGDYSDSLEGVDWNLY